MQSNGIPAMAETTTDPETVPEIPDSVPDLLASYTVEIEVDGVVDAAEDVADGLEEDATLVVCPEVGEDGPEEVGDVGGHGQADVAEHDGEEEDRQTGLLPGDLVRQQEQELLRLLRRLGLGLYSEIRSCILYSSKSNIFVSSY